MTITAHVSCLGICSHITFIDIGRGIIRYEKYADKRGTYIISTHGFQLEKIIRLIKRK